MCLKVTRGPEGTTLFYEAPKRRAGAGGGKIWVPGLQGHCCETPAPSPGFPASLCPSVSEASRWPSCRQHLPVQLPASWGPPPRSPEVTSLPQALDAVFFSPWEILTRSQVQGLDDLWGCFQATQFFCPPPASYTCPGFLAQTVAALPATERWRPSRSLSQRLAECCVHG